jgi:hypothetical protein
MFRSELARENHTGCQQGQLILSRRIAYRKPFSVQKSICVQGIPMTELLPI